MSSVFQKRIKIFTDSSDKKHMLETAKNPLVGGFTTNPSLMRKAGVTDYRAFCKEILGEITDKPISFEVFADDVKEMERQALEITTWGKNVYVKIPVSNSEGVTTYDLIKSLTKKGVKLNVTAIFTIKQTFEVCRSLEGGAPSVVSVFAGRIADTGRDPLPIMAAAREICRAHGSQQELLWASTREVYNIVQAEQVGCDIITVPPDIIAKMKGFDRPLEEVSLDTVKTFKADSLASGFKL